jgi:hypothetical protein
LSEIGRRVAIIFGGSAFTISVLIGVISNGDLMYTCVLGLLAGIFFGTGGLLIGNLAEKYVYQAAQREVTRRAMEQKIAQELIGEKGPEETEEGSQDEI